MTKNAADQRVIGGFTCSTEDYPFMVVIMRLIKGTLWKRFCGGSLIHASWVLTAAHCLANKTEMLVIAAINSPRPIKLLANKDNFFIHPQYFSENKVIHDIALIRLDKPVSKSNHITFISIPSQPYTPSYLELICQKALVMGWGKTSNELITDTEPNLLTLQCAMLPIISQEECQDLYRRHVIAEEEMCTLSREGKDSCTGDSGGPLLCAAVQTGIVSWGEGCGSDSRPGVLTRVDKYLNFIEKTINSFKSRENTVCYLGNIVLLCFLLFLYIVI